MTQKYGVSFSYTYSQYLGIDPKKCLNEILKGLRVKRLRLMSYWPLHEPEPGKYDFKELDWQIKLAEEYNAEVTLCLGLRQPHWPESHWPEWATQMPDNAWQEYLLSYIKTVINRYKDSKAIVSYQLENEAMLKRFGLKGNFDRNRFKKEFRLVKEADPSKPVIMTMSDSWGLPWFGPKPDLFGFSIYRYFFDRGDYRHSSRRPLFYRVRAVLIRLKSRRKVFIHELQCEPWGPKAIPDMKVEQQINLMSKERINEMIDFAKATKLFPIDLWGAEWWYYLKTEHNKPEIWEYIKAKFTQL